MGRYAETTDVPADRSRAEIERVLIRYGASGFGYSWEKRDVVRNPIPAYGPKTEQRMFAVIVFQFKDRRIRLDLSMPNEREAGTVAKAEQATRQRWRALLLVIKAKLEAVESGISTLEHEFLANIVTDSGRTIGDVVVPRLTEAIESGRLLPAKAGA
jgi:hypothetical protein